MDFSSAYFVGSEWQRWGGWEGVGVVFYSVPAFFELSFGRFFLFDCFCFVVSVVSRRSCDFFW